MLIVCFESDNPGFFIKKFFFAYLIYKINNTKTGLYLRHFIKAWYFVIANLVHTNKTNHVLRNFQPELVRHLGYILRRSFYRSFVNQLSEI